jgi:hypothetical protein
VWSTVEIVTRASVMLVTAVPADGDDNENGKRVFFLNIH